MSIESPTANELFSVHIFKALTQSPTLVWCNTYEVIAIGETVTYDDLLNMCDAFVAFEQDMCLDDVSFQKVVLSTWTPDGTPYDPSTFVSKSLSMRGSIVSGATEIMPLSIVLNITRAATVGKKGRIALRGALTEADIISNTGTPRLVAPPIFEARLNNAVLTNLTDYISTNGQITMALIDKHGAHRKVTELAIGPVTNHKTTRRRKIKAVTPTP